MEAKNFLSSITIWGGILSILPLVTEALDKVTNSGAIPPKYAPIVSGVGAILAIFGRARAKQPIKLI